MIKKRFEITIRTIMTRRGVQNHKRANTTKRGFENCKRTSQLRVRKKEEEGFEITRGAL